MTYQIFKENIKTVIQTKLGANVKVIIQDIIKNNNTHFDGLSILSNNINYSPTIYLNRYYTQYLNGTSMDEIYRDILTIYTQNEPTVNLDVSFFTDYEKVKHRIVYKLVHYERNRALLNKIPHIKFLDLAIVFSCLIETNSSENAVILIYNHHLAFWNLTTDDLYALAVKNTPLLLPWEIRNLSDVIFELQKNIDPFAQKSADTCVPMYILSNKPKLNGSACILYNNLLADLSKKLDCDLYILPSSIHEVLLVPSCQIDSSDDLSDIVKEVNAAELAPEEILSDHTYFYSQKTNCLTI